MDKLEAEESVSMSSEDVVVWGMRVLVPALNRRLVTGGAAMIWFSSEEVEKVEGGMRSPLSAGRGVMSGTVGTVGGSMGGGAGP
jgi:hypothetical protein